MLVALGRVWCGAAFNFPLPQAPRIKKVVPKTDEQLKDIETAISRCFLFSSLCEAQRKEVSGPAGAAYGADFGTGFKYFLASAFQHSLYVTCLLSSLGACLERLDGLCLVLGSLEPGFVPCILLLWSLFSSLFAGRSMPSRNDFHRCCRSLVKLDPWLTPFPGIRILDVQ